MNPGHFLSTTTLQKKPMPSNCLVCQLEFICTQSTIMLLKCITAAFQCVNHAYCKKHTTPLALVFTILIDLFRTVLQHLPSSICSNRPRTKLMPIHAYTPKSRKKGRCTEGLPEKKASFQSNSVLAILV